MQKIIHKSYACISVFIIVILTSCDQKSAFLPATNFSMTSINKINLLFPKNQTTGIQNKIQVEWSGIAVDGTLYEVYFSKTTTGLTVIASDIKGTRYAIDNLESKQTYYWKIIGRNSLGIYESDVYSFTTGDFWVSAPLLTYPSVENINLPLAINFQWEKSLSSDGSDAIYDLYVGKASASMLKVAASIKETNFTYSGLESFTRYYWKIIAKNTINNTAESKETRSFTTANIPSTVTVNTATLLFPANEATDVLTDVVLSWSKTVASDNSKITYDVYLDNSISPANKIASSTTDNFCTVKGLLGSKKYFWKIVVKSSSGLINESAVSNFKTISKISNLNNVFPVDKSIDQSINSALTWSNATSSDNSAITYKVYLDTDLQKIQSSNAPSQLGGILTTTSITTTNLLGNKTYYWKVEASTSSGLRETSSIFTFVTEATVTAPVINSPTNESTGQSIFSTLTWNPSSSSNGENVVYKIYLDLSTNPSSYIASSTSASYTLTQRLTPSQKYYWKVEATIIGKSSFSSINNFTTSVGITNIALSYPTEASENQSVLPLLSWTTATSLDGSPVIYDVYVGTATDQLFKLTTNSISTTSYQIITSLAQGTTHYWKVVARNTNGVTLSSTIGSFKTVSLSSPTFLTPNVSSTTQNLLPTLRWTASTGGTGIVYDVYMDKDNVNPTTLKYTGLTGTSQTLATNLQDGSTYYWKVIARNNEKATASSNVSSFATATLVAFTGVSTILGDGTNSSYNSYIVSTHYYGVTAQWTPVYTLSATSYTASDFTYEIRYINNVSTLTNAQILAKLKTTSATILNVSTEQIGNRFMDESFAITGSAIAYQDPNFVYFYIIRVYGPNGYVKDSPMRWFLKVWSSVPISKNWVTDFAN